MEAAPPDDAATFLVEHRAKERVAIAVEVDLASDSHFFAGLTGDISEGGLMISTYRSLGVGSNVEIELFLPDGHGPLHARGDVRWVREHSPTQPRAVGVAFAAMSAHDAGRIREFCRRRPALYYDID